MTVSACPHPNVYPSVKIAAPASAKLPANEQPITSAAVELKSSAPPGPPTKLPSKVHPTILAGLMSVCAVWMCHSAPA